MKPKLGRPRLFLARGNQLTASWVMNSSGNHYVNVLHNMTLAGYITQALSTLIILSGPVFATQVLLMRGYHWHCIRRLYINIWLLSRTMECQHAEHRGYNSTSTDLPGAFYFCNMHNFNKRMTVILLWRHNSPTVVDIDGPR